MTRRSSSNRWSRPATGKQIAALKAHGNYDGKYYSMGRASSAIGAGLARGRRGSKTGGGRSAGSVYSSSAASELGTSLLASRLFELGDDLDSGQQAALEGSPESPLVSSGTGPTSLLSQILELPDDIDSLILAALGVDDRDGTSGTPLDDTVESVLYTIRSDDSRPGEPHIVVEAEVIHAKDFDGQPSLQVRFIGGNDQNGSQSAGLIPPSRLRPALAYRPRWTPVLVHTPSELAEQMRVRWTEAMEELRTGVDPRMETFLRGVGSMESAVAVLASNQSPASKFVLLQGLMDPAGQIQYKGLGLDAPTFAAQIRGASEGNENALDWLEDVQRAEVLTSLSEVTGISLFAEADFRLSRWHKQGMKLIRAVTAKSETAEFDFSMIRWRLTTQEEMRILKERNRHALAALRESFQDDQIFSAIADWSEHLDVGEDSSSEYGILEDWFFEESRLFFKARFRESLPGRFAAALTPVSDDVPGHSALVDVTRQLADSASTDPSDYSMEPVESGPLYFGGFRYDSEHVESNRARRIIQAVRRASEDARTAEADDLGKLIVAQEVLAYAQWRRDELRAEEQLREAESHRSSATHRHKTARKLAKKAKLLKGQVRQHVGDAKDVERIVQDYSDALARTPHVITIEDPVSSTALSAARARVAHAQQRQTCASERLAASEEWCRWATATASVAATPIAKEQLLADRDSAVAEQSEARAELNKAIEEETAAQSDMDLLSEARTKFDCLIRDVRAANDRRVREELEHRRQEQALKAEQQRQRAEDLRRKSEADRRQEQAERRREEMDRRQEDLNQWQQDRAEVAKNELPIELEQLLTLPENAPFWRRKALAKDRVSLQEKILLLQGEIVGPLVPTRTRSRTWPNMLSCGERYLGTVKKITDYGVFVSLPAGADGLLRGADATTLSERGQLVVVEIVEMPLGKPIILQRISDWPVRSHPVVPTT